MKRLVLVLALSAAAGCSHPAPARYQVFGINKFRQVRNEPSHHVGKLYAFAGTVINAEQTRERVAFQILVQDRIAEAGERLRGDGPLTVVYAGSDTTVADNHQVKVLGFIRGPDVGDNVFGETVSSFKLEAIAVHDAFTGYAFWLDGYEELHNKWKTGEPLTQSASQSPGNEPIGGA